MQKDSPFFSWVAMLSLSWFQVGQENVIFYRRHLLLSYVTSEHCSEKNCPLQWLPSKQGLTFRARGGFCCRGRREEKNDLGQKCISVTHESNARRDLPTRSPASPGFSQRCLRAVQRAGACTTPRGARSSAANTCLLPLSLHSLARQCSGGNSCRMLPVIHLILSHL